MKRKPKLTKRERKAQAPARPQATGEHHHEHAHIHCIACGKHLDEDAFEPPATATVITCDHGSTFPACISCMPRALAAVKEHDQTNRPVKVAPAWH